jgi:uncharacterized membrane protein YfcA
MRSLSNWNAAEPKSEADLDGDLLADAEMGGGNETALVFPAKVIVVVVALWLVYTGFVTASALCDTCSAEQWVVGFIFFLPFIFAVRASVDIASERQRKDPELQLNGDVDFTSLGVGPPIYTFLIGILCALLGIGGGELAGPLLVSMGLIPQVVAATTSMFSLYGSSATVVGTLVTVKLNPGTSLLAFGLGLLGGLSGRLLAIKVVARLGRPSMTVFTLVVCLTLSAVAMVYAVATDEVDMDMHEVC